MSQEKVDKYKEYKVNKQKIWKREKRIHRLELGCVVLLCALFLSWIGFSVYQKASQSDEAKTATAVELNVGALEDYFSTLNADAE